MGKTDRATGQTRQSETFRVKRSGLYRKATTLCERRPATTDDHTVITETVRSSRTEGAIVVRLIPPTAARKKASSTS